MTMIELPAHTHQPLITWVTGHKATPDVLPICKVGWKNRVGHLCQQ